MAPALLTDEIGIKRQRGLDMGKELSAFCAPQHNPEGKNVLRSGQRKRR